MGRGGGTCLEGWHRWWCVHCWRLVSVQRTPRPRALRSASPGCPPAVRHRKRTAPWIYTYGLDSQLRVTGDEYISLKWLQTVQGGDAIRSAAASGLDAGRVILDWTRRRVQGFSYQNALVWSGPGYDPGVGFEPRRRLCGLVTAQCSQTTLHPARNPSGALRLALQRGRGEQQLLPKPPAPDLGSLGRRDAWRIPLQLQDAQVGHARAPARSARRSFT